MQLNITGFDISVEETLSSKPKPAFFSAADKSNSSAFLPTIKPL